MAFEPISQEYTQAFDNAFKEVETYTLRPSHETFVAATLAVRAGREAAGRLGRETIGGLRRTPRLIAHEITHLDKLYMVGKQTHDVSREQEVGKIALSRGMHLDFDLPHWKERIEPPPSVALIMLPLLIDRRGKRPTVREQDTRGVYIALEIGRAVSFSGQISLVPAKEIWTRDRQLFNPGFFTWR